MKLAARQIELVFYRSAAGNEPVRDWLSRLREEDRRAIGIDLQRVQYRWPVGCRWSDPMGKGLFEVRTDLPDRTIARVLFCFTPADLKLARDRKKEIESG